MGKAQELFDKAAGAYDEAIELIRALDEGFQDAALQDEAKRRYDTRITLSQFDMILQAVLLSQSLSDGSFDPLERQFVDEITDYGDLLTYVRKKTDGKVDLSWDSIATMDRSTQQDLLKMLPALLDELCDSFVRPLALVDRAMEQEDFLRALEQYVGQIGLYLSQIDGVVRRNENNAAGAMLGELLHARWRKYLR